MNQVTIYLPLILLLWCNLCKSERNQRNAFAHQIQDPGFGYVNGYDSQGHVFNHFGTQYPEYPYEAGVYYNYPGLGQDHGLYPGLGHGQGHDQGHGLYPSNFDYKPLSSYPYQPDLTSGYYPQYYPQFPQQPGWQYNYGGNYPGIGLNSGNSDGSVTPVPFDYNNYTPGYGASGNKPFSTKYFNNLGFINNNPTNRPNSLTPIVNVQRRPLNRVPLVVNPGKAGGTLPEPNLSWQIPNRQF